jgi:hypothetical protein
MDTEEGVGMTVKVSGDPALPTLADVATETAKLPGLDVKYMLKAAAITMTITTIARILVRDKRLLHPPSHIFSVKAYSVFGEGVITVRPRCFMVITVS